MCAVSFSSFQILKNRKLVISNLNFTGQSLLLSALGPLFYAKKFVLVGDPEQLPPVVKSQVARDLGMDQSLFSHLQDDDNTIALSVQYRMNQCIQDLANFMTYEGQLECGSDEVAGKLVHLDAAADSEMWPLCIPLGTARTSAVAFFDTSQLKEGTYLHIFL